MSSSAFQRALKFARSVVESVVRDIGGLNTRIEQEVMNVLRQQIQEVVGGAWKGYGAEAFMETLDKQYIPRATRCIQGGVFVNTSVNTATQIITEADANVKTSVQQFADAINDI
jgi:uncharacterized protein YukE